MGLADRLVKTEPKSKFQAWLDELTEANRTIVLSWLVDRDISNQRVADMIRDDDPEDEFYGYRANKSTISEWRRNNGAR